MTINRICRILSRLKLSLYLLFVVLAAMSCYLVILLNNSAAELNAVSAESSSQIFESVVRRELDAIGKLTKDYAYWTDSVEKLAVAHDPDFIESNFLGSYMGDSFGISRVIVADLDNHITLSVVDGEVEQTPDPLLSSKSLQELMTQSLENDMAEPEPATGFVKIGQGIHIMACVPITPNDDRDPRFHFGKPYGVLVMSKPLNTQLINTWASDFKFNAAKLQFSQSSPPDFQAKTIMNPLGERLATIIWKAEQPGALFLASNSLTLAIFLLVLALITAFFIVNIRRYIEMSLVTARQLEESQHELSTLAYYDSVTGLPNRSLAMDRLLQSLNAMQRNECFTAVMFIDLDGFKPVNDMFGHAIGDKVLTRVGKRLTGCLRKEDTLARVGGDEFLVILSGLTCEADVDDVAKKILTTVGQSFQVGDTQVELTASIGVALAPRDGMDPEALITRADDAMYCSKKGGKNQYQFFTEILPT